MSLIVQQACTADAANIAAFSRQTFYDTFAAFNTKENMDKFMNESFSMDRLMAEVGAEGNIFILALLDGELAGYAKITESNNPPGLGHVSAIEIARIYAGQKVIGQGVGKALMAECLRLAALKNKQMIWLGVWEHNERAISFYKKIGFEKFGEHDFVLGDDVQTDWLMKKDLYF
jgi:ribosomal protein S18 acetylase RimI-like enzyme